MTQWKHKQVHDGGEKEPKNRWTRCSFVGFGQVLLPFSALYDFTYTAVVRFLLPQFFHFIDQIKAIPDFFDSVGRDKMQFARFSPSDNDSSALFFQRDLRVLAHKFPPTILTFPTHEFLRNRTVIAASGWHLRKDLCRAAERIEKFHFNRHF